MMQEARFRSDAFADLRDEGDDVVLDLAFDLRGSAAR